MGNGTSGQYAAKDYYYRKERLEQGNTLHPALVLLLGFLPSASTASHRTDHRPGAAWRQHVSDEGRIL
jgi:hypothetical protein